MFRDIYVTFTRFLHNFGAMWLFVVRMALYTPSVFVKRFRQVAY